MKAIEQMGRELFAVAKKLDNFGDSISGDIVGDAAEMIEALQAQLADEKVTSQSLRNAANGYKARLAERDREIERLRKFKAYFLDEMYGEGLEVVNWHMNGDTEPFDIFFDSAVDYMNGPLPAPPEESP